MDARHRFLQMFRYDAWANRSCLDAIRAIDPPPAKVLRLLAHVVAAQRLWLDRLLQVPQSIAVWPSLSFAECSALAEEMPSAWKKYLKDLPAESFDSTVEYRNSKGELWTSRADDILTHVVMHSAYHRGQVALEMRTAGLVPAYTDFIHGVRQGLIE